MNICLRIINYLKRKFTRFVYKYCVKRFEKDIIYNAFLNRVYRNINIDLLNKRQKKVFISYLIPSDYDYVSDQIAHTNRLECAVIVNYFIKKGYCIDLMSCSASNFDNIPSGYYDVVFGLGNPFTFACDKNPAAKKIIYLTECAPSFSEKFEKERLDYYFERHGKKLNYERTFLFFNNDMIAKADYGLFFGNQWTVKPYHEDFQRLQLQLISPSGFVNNLFKPKFSCRKHNKFVWFGSFGVIHKGLDILLDVFKDLPEYELIICGLSKSDYWILQGYDGCKNIINKGFLDVQSNDFLTLVDEVPFVIFPSCSEAMSTAVLTMMLHGLIPVVTKNCGIDVGDFGFFIEDFHIENVKLLIHNIMCINTKDLKEMQSRAYSYARKNFLLESFDKKFSKSMDKFRI